MATETTRSEVLKSTWVKTVLEAAKLAGHISSREVARLLATSEEVGRRRLNQLVEAGILVEDRAARKASKYKAYTLADGIFDLNTVPKDRQGREAAAREAHLVMNSAARRLVQAIERGALTDGPMRTAKVARVIGRIPPSRIPYLNRCVDRLLDELGSFSADEGDLLTVTRAISPRLETE